MPNTEKPRKRKSTRSTEADAGVEMHADAPLKTLADQLEELSAANASTEGEVALGESISEIVIDASALGHAEPAAADLTSEASEVFDEERMSEMAAALVKLSAEGGLQEPNLDFIDGTANVDESTALDLILKSLPESHMVVGEPEQLPILGMEEAEEEANSEEPVEFIDNDKLISILESLLFATDKPVSIATMKVLFKGSNIKSRDIQRALDILASSYASADRGVSLEEIHGGYQLRTKVDNTEYLKRLAKVRPFRLSGPALEVLAIAAYKQPITKTEVDQIRGVESGHLMRALMERGLVGFGEKSDLPGRPMTYVTTRKFLETFGLRNLKELPTLAEIDQLLPEGIGDEEEKETLSDVTDAMANQIGSTYSEGEEELQDISESLKVIDTTSEFFEQEKVRQRVERDQQKAQDIRDKMAFGDEVDDKDRRWLSRFEAKQEQIAQAAQTGRSAGPLIVEEEGESAITTTASGDRAETAAGALAADGEALVASTEDGESVADELAALSDESSHDTKESSDDDEATDELAVNPDYDESDFENDRDDETSNDV